VRGGAVRRRASFGGAVTGRRLVKVWVVLLAALATGPLLVSRGYALVGDMVFVPHQPWKAAWLGLDGSVPRAVPSDAMTWLASQMLPDDLVQKAVLLGLMVAAGLGMVRLVGSERPLAGLVAATLYVWNPFVYERLAIGHWALLCGYAALPWTAVAACRVRDAQPGGSAGGLAGGLGGLVLPLAVAAWTSPTGGVLAASTALAVVLASARWRSATACLLLGVVLNLPWILPGLLNAADQLSADTFGVSAFAARADTPWGALGSLMSFGGMWKVLVAPPGRDSWVLSGVGLALTAAGLVGLWLARWRRLAWSLGAAALVGLVLAVAPATALGADVFGWAVEHVPGAGILRDSQKWLMPFVLAVCWGAGLLADRILDRRSAHERFWVVGAALLPLAAMPGMAWGLLGELDPVSYPDEWASVREQMTELHADESRVVVLPFSLYRRFDWNDDRAVLDPAPRYFPGELVTDDALVVTSGTVAGESRLADRIRGALGSPETLERTLREEGVRFVLVENGTPGEVPPLPATVLHAGEELNLLEIERPRELTPTTLARGVGLVDALVFTGAVGAAGVAAWRRRSAYTSRREHESFGGN
jgi:hypothetical protein